MQDLLPDSAAEALPHLPSRMPRSASFPPASSTPLLDDLPGQAVAVMSESDSAVDSYYAYREFEDVNAYFLGVDGRWRSLNLGDLGIDPGDFTSDVILRLSQDGRYCLFRTFTRAAVLDLTTGELRLIEPERPQIERPEWLPNGTFMMGSWTATGPHAQWVLVDPRTGRQRDWNGPRLDLLSFKTDGTPVGIDRGPSKVRTLVELGADGKPGRSTAIPFGFRGRVWAEFSTDRIAFDIGRLDVQDRPARRGAIVVTDASATPQAVLPRDKALQRPIGWIDDRTLLLYTEVGRDARFLAWRPDEERLYWITALDTDTTLEIAVGLVLGAERARATFGSS